MNTEKQENSEAFKLAPLNEICRTKSYYCYSLELPSIKEVQAAYTVLEMSEATFLIELLDYQVFLQKLEDITQKTGLSKEEIIAQAITLLEIEQKAKANGKRIHLI